MGFEFQESPDMPYRKLWNRVNSKCNPDEYAFWGRDLVKVVSIVPDTIPGYCGVVVERLEDKAQLTIKVPQ